MNPYHVIRSRPEIAVYRGILREWRYNAPVMDMSSTCSARLLEPMKRFVSLKRFDPALVPDAFWRTSLDERVPLEQVQEMLLGAVEHLGDGRLGLTLGRSMRFGEGGAFDYAVQSAATISASLDVAARHCTVVSDSLTIWHELRGSQVIVQLRDDASWTEPGAEFTLSAFYKLHLSNALPASARLECWFPYSEPGRLDDHLASFPAALLRFSAPFFGFSFDRDYLDAPMPGADPLLHPAHCHRVQSLMEGLKRRPVTSLRVRRVIFEQMQRLKGSPSSRVANALGISRRTLSRRLEQEGTTFGEELDRVRRETALVHVGDTNTTFTEIAFLLGFSHVESFHRAFKRWTGVTPLAYRTRRLAG